MGLRNLFGILGKNATEKREGDEDYWKETEDQDPPEAEPEPAAMSEEQREAVDTAAILAHGVFDALDNYKRSRKSHGGNVSVADGNRIKAYHGFLQALEGDDPEKAVEAAVRVFADLVNEKSAALERAKTRLNGISVRKPNNAETVELTPGTAEAISGIGEEIRVLEQDLAEYHANLIRLAKRANQA